MSKEAAPSPRLKLVRERLQTPLRHLRARAKLARETAAIRVGELERVAFHVRQQKLVRENGRSRNQLLFAHGSNAEIGDYLEVDQYAHRGLEAHPDLYALWNANAAATIAPRSKGDLLRCIFDDDERRQFCVSEGLRVSWEFARAAREDQTARFLERQKSDPKQLWRKEPRTGLQDYLMELISLKGGFAIPGGMRRGKAHDWIAAHGAHPDFWSPPPAHPEWVLA